MHETLQSLSHPGAEDPVKVEGTEAGDGGQVFKIQGIGQMTLDVVDYTVHPGGVFAASGFRCVCRHLFTLARLRRRLRSMTYAE